jgi:hypothetical protein
VRNNTRRRIKIEVNQDKARRTSTTISEKINKPHGVLVLCGKTWKTK